MEAELKHARIWLTAALGLIAALLLVRLSAFGIWDPWELSTAELARGVLQGEAVSLLHRGPLLVTGGFAALGVHEWSGRLPIALCGLVAVALSYALVAAFASRRAALYTVLIVGTSPLFLFNSRAMLGDAPSMALQTAIGLGAARTLLDKELSARRRAGWLLATLALCVLGVWLRGALLLVLPPLGAAVAVAATRQDPRPAAGGRWPRPATLLLGAATVALAALVARAVWADHSGGSIWIGGKPRSGDPPSFDEVIGTVFHAFAPWSALLPLALPRMLWARPQAAESGDEAAGTGQAALRAFLVLWAAGGYLAQTVFISRYGQAVAYLPVAALGAIVALGLRDLERERRAHWPAAIAAAMLALLLIRDYALYPQSPVRGMPLNDFAVPEVFNPKRWWIALLATFGLLSLLGLSAAPASGKPLRELLGAPYRLLRDQWRRDVATKAWLLGLALVLLALLVGGVVGLAVSDDARALSTQGRKWLLRLSAVPIALPVVVALMQVIHHGYARLYGLRLAPVLCCGAVVGLYAAQGFMPALSAHFSPREVYDTYNALAKPDEPLAEYEVGGRAAAYYAKGQVVALDSPIELKKYLLEEERRWAVLPADKLATVDRTFRRASGDHLFVADARSARVLLVTNQPVPGRPNQSFLVRNVLSEAPDIQHPVKANLDDRIEFLGYDLELPHGHYVGAGERFRVTWYYRALRSQTGNWKVFVHIDGQGARIHGDHFPLDNKYPVRMWDEGDVIVDTQSLDVPANYRPGAYTIYLGFYQGETRMEVKEGPSDKANRVIAGVLRIR